MQEWKHWLHYFNYFLHSVLIFFIFIMAVEQFSLWQLCHFKNILNRASKILVMGNWLIDGDCNERGGDVFSFWAYTSHPDVIQRVRKQLHFATFAGSIGNQFILVDLVADRYPLLAKGIILEILMNWDVRTVPVCLGSDGFGFCIHRNWQFDSMGNRWLRREDSPFSTKKSLWLPRHFTRVNFWRGFLDVLFVPLALSSLDKNHTHI